MSKSKGSSGPADQQTRLRVTLYPWTTHTVAEIDLGRRGGGGADFTRLAYWHLDVRRRDLSGRSTDDVLRILIDSLVRHLDGAHDTADAQAVGETTRPAAPAPLEGPQGEAHTQTPLPGLEPTL